MNKYFTILVCALSLSSHLYSQGAQFQFEEENDILPNLPQLFDPMPILDLYAEIIENMDSRETQVFFNHPLNLNLSEQVVNFINNAEEEILINTYAITDISIAQALLRAHAMRGVRVILIMEPRPSIRNYRTPTFFIENSIPTFFSQQEGVNNNSYILVDQKHVLTGSMNFTQTSLNRNAENMLVIKNNRDLATAFYLNFLLHLSFSEIPELLLLKNPGIQEELLEILGLQ